MGVSCLDVPSFRCELPLNLSGPALNLYARLQARVNSNGGASFIRQDWEKRTSSLMQDVQGQFWNLPGLIGRHWTMDAKLPNVESMTTGMELAPNALEDPHTLGWVVAGTFKPFQWMEEDHTAWPIWSQNSQDEVTDWRARMIKVVQQLAPEAREDMERRASEHLLASAQQDFEGPDQSKSIQRWLNASSRWLVEMTTQPSAWQQPYPSPLAQGMARTLVMSLFLMERSGVYAYSIKEALSPGSATDWHVAQGSVALRQAWIDVALGCLGSPIAPPTANSISGEAPAGALRALWGIKAISTLMQGAPAAELPGLYDALEPILPALRTQLNLLRTDWGITVPFGDRLEVMALKGAFLDNIDVQLRAARLDALLPSAPSAPRLRM